MVVDDCEGDVARVRVYGTPPHVILAGPGHGRAFIHVGMHLDPTKQERTIRGPCLGKNLGKLDCMKLLIVKDEASAAAYLRRGLSEEGYAVDVASDAAQARRVVALFES